MGAYCCPFQSNHEKPDYIFLESKTKCVESEKKVPSSSHYNKKNTSQSKTDQYNNEVFQKSIFSNYDTSEVSSKDSYSNECVEETIVCKTACQKQTSQKEEIPQQINNNDGAYLIYNSSNNGSLLTCWSTCSVPNALVFAQRKPNLFIPNFRYRQKTMLISSIHVQQKNVLEGLLLFFKSIRAFQNKVIFFNLKNSIAKIPPIYCFLYTDQNKVSVLCGENEAENLMETKMIALCFFSEKCVHDFTLLKNEAYVEFEDFKRLCAKYSNILCTTIIK